MCINLFQVTITQLLFFSSPESIFLHVCQYSFCVISWYVLALNNNPSFSFSEFCQFVFCIKTNTNNLLTKPTLLSPRYPPSGFEMSHATQTGTGVCIQQRQDVSCSHSWKSKIPIKDALPLYYRAHSENEQHTCTVEYQCHASSYKTKRIWKQCGPFRFYYKHSSHDILLL